MKQEARRLIFDYIYIPMSVYSGWREVYLSNVMLCSRAMRTAPKSGTRFDWGE